MARPTSSGSSTTATPRTPTRWPRPARASSRTSSSTTSPQGLATEPTAFDGRSDYDAFISVGIPAGGLFTGAEGVKTAEAAAIYGGTAGVAYDPCYHQACDTFVNLSNTALDQMSDAAAHATLAFAMTNSAIEGTDKGKGKAKGHADFLEFPAPEVAA